jgi:drug/metabolite transporter (DMT)-like permease
VNKENRKNLGYIYSLLFCLVRSLIIVLSKYLLSFFNPWLLGLFYSSIGAISIFLVYKEKSHFREIKKVKILLILIVIGILGSIFNLCLLVGLKHSTAINSSILLRAEIMFSVILGWIFLKEKLTIVDFLGALVMLLGFLFVSEIRINQIKFYLRGDILFLTGAFVVSVNALLIKKLLSYGLSGSVIATYNLTITTIFFTFFTLLFKQYFDFVFLFIGKNFFLVILLGIFIGISYVLYYGALRHIPIWLVKVLVLFIPVFTVIISYVFLSEIITKRQLIGILLTVIGGVIILYNQSSKVTK